MYTVSLSKTSSEYRQSGLTLVVRHELKTSSSFNLEKIIKITAGINIPNKVDII